MANKPWLDGIEGDHVRRLIESDAAAIQTVAGPGSGKTTGLKGRIRRLVEGDGVAPGKIFAGTFTRAIAADLLVALSEAIPAENTEKPVVLTLHSLALQMLRDTPMAAPGRTFRFLLEHEEEAMLYDVGVAVPGCARWVRPWSQSRVPANALTHRPYRGANILALWMTQTIEAYPTAEWLSFRQALHLGGNVRKGEHGTPIFFYSVLERDDARAKDGVRRVPLLRSYTIFNVAQCNGLPVPNVSETPSEFERLEDAQAFLGAIGATVRHGGDQAFYSPSTDAITLPAFTQFEAPEHYYGTSLHEHGHWTGAKHRLAREFGKRFGDDAYAFEELVAELTSAFLCAELEIAGNLRHPEYLSHWVRILRSDAKAILSAGARASEAADYLARLAGRRAMDVDESAEEAA